MKQDAGKKASAFYEAKANGLNTPFGGLGFDLYRLLANSEGRALQKNSLSNDSVDKRE